MLHDILQNSAFIIVKKKKPKIWMVYLRKGEAVHSMTNPSFTVFHCRRLFGCIKNYCLGIFNSYTTLKKQDKVNQNTTNFFRKKPSEQNKEWTSPPTTPQKHSVFTHSPELQKIPQFTYIILRHFTTEIFTSHESQSIDKAILWGFLRGKNFYQHSFQQPFLGNTF